MGIPKYFRYISEKYKELVIKLDDFSGSIDTLCFDLNGLIHPCARKVVDDNLPLVDSFYRQILDPRYSEDISFLSDLEHKMFSEIISRVEDIISRLPSINTVFVAIDGIAPLAKIDQQRKRRWGSYRDTLEKKEIYKKHSIPFPPHWDTNLITPGTPFMDKLNHHLKHYFDSRHSHQTILFTGSDEKGEGEHKIMDFIRSSDVSLTYCIYGLDADLIMLSLLQKPNIFLLRESVHFGVIDMDNFLLFDIPSFKNKVIHEMGGFELLSTDTTEDINIFDIIDDYVVLGFLLGNDFLPKIVSIETNDGCISKLLEFYKDLLKMRQNTIVKNGRINFNALSLVLSRYLIEYEHISLKDKERRLQHWKPRIKDNLSDFEMDLEKIKYENKDYFANLGPDGKRKTIRYDEKDWEERHYNLHLKIMDTSKERDFILSIRQKYVDGIEWVFDYYKGLISDWQWRFGLDETVVLKEIVEEMRERVYEKEKIVRGPISLLEFKSLVFPHS